MSQAIGLKHRDTPQVACAGCDSEMDRPLRHDPDEWVLCGRCEHELRQDPVDLLADKNRRIADLEAELLQARNGGR